MLVGILSDSHGRYRLVRAALALFDQSGVSYVIHCGDVGGVPVFDELVGRPCTFVWGNTDYPDDALEAYLDSVDIPRPREIPTMLTLGGKTFAVFHGHEADFAAAEDFCDVDYICHGHTHVPRNDVVGSCRIINPGALHRTRRPTVATLEVSSGTVTFHDITAK